MKGLRISRYQAVSLKQITPPTQCLQHILFRQKNPRVQTNPGQTSPDNERSQAAVVPT
jgi:hypothetical protein